MESYNWAEILEGTKALNYSLRSFEASFFSEENEKTKGLRLPQTYVDKNSKQEWLGRCNLLEQKTLQIFTPELMSPFKFSVVQVDFVYGLIKEMRNPTRDYKSYRFEFDLDSRKVSSVMDTITHVREVHSDEDRLFDVFEKNGWQFKEVPFL